MSVQNYTLYTPAGGVAPVLGPRSVRLCRNRTRNLRPRLHTGPSARTASGSGIAGPKKVATSPGLEELAHRAPTATRGGSVLPWLRHGDDFSNRPTLPMRLSPENRRRHPRSMGTSRTMAPCGCVHWSGANWKGRGGGRESVPQHGEGAQSVPVVRSHAKHGNEVTDNEQSTISGGQARPLTANDLV